MELYRLGDGNAIVINPGGPHHGVVFRQASRNRWVRMRKVFPIPQPELERSPEFEPLRTILRETESRS